MDTFFVISFNLIVVTLCLMHLRTQRELHLLKREYYEHKFQMLLFIQTLCEGIKNEPTDKN